MTTFVWAAVLGAALLHALWNSLVESAPDKFLGSARVALWMGVVAALVAFVTPRPFLAATPYIIATAVVHVVYFLLVGRLYRNADLSVAYPLMRGLAPLIAIAIAAATLQRDPRWRGVGRRLRAGRRASRPWACRGLRTGASIARRLRSRAGKFRDHRGSTR